MQGALLDGLVDPRDQSPVLGLGGSIIAGFDRPFEAAEVRLYGAGEAAVLLPLALSLSILLTGHHHLHYAQCAEHTAPLFKVSGYDGSALCLARALGRECRQIIHCFLGGNGIESFTLEGA